MRDDLDEFLRDRSWTSIVYLPEKLLFQKEEFHLHRLFQQNSLKSFPIL